jgi:hypothetical protein
MSGEYYAEKTCQGYARTLSVGLLEAVLMRGYIGLAFPVGRIKYTLNEDDLKPAVVSSSA